MCVCCVLPPPSTLCAPMCACPRTNCFNNMCFVCAFIHIWLSNSVRTGATGIDPARNNCSDRRCAQTRLDSYITQVRRIALGENRNAYEIELSHGDCVCVSYSLSHAFSLVISRLTQLRKASIAHRTDWGFTGKYSLTCASKSNNIYIVFILLEVCVRITIDGVIGSQPPGIVECLFRAETHRS